MTVAGTIFMGERAARDFLRAKNTFLEGQLLTLAYNAYCTMTA